MDRAFEGRLVLVTGASTGIGAAIARGAAGAGAHVVMHYNHNERAARELQREIRDEGGEATLEREDLSRSGAGAALVGRVAERHAGLDVLVNNAGAMGRRSPVADVTAELYDEVFDLNVRSVVEACRAAIPHLRRSQGCVVNVGSIAARTGGGPGAALYASTKGAIATFTRGLAKELAPDGVRVNAISPGLIRTPFHDGVTTDEQFERLAAAIPMGRAGTAEDCVGPALFLADPQAAGFMTGQLLEVNGGQFSP